MLFEKAHVNEDEGWTFIEQVAHALELPVTLDGTSRTVTHKVGLEAKRRGQLNGLRVELVRNDLGIFSEYFQKFQAFSGGAPGETSWSVSPPKGVPGEAAYAALVASQLPGKSVTFNYEFTFPQLELVPELHRLCVKPGDKFTVPLGSFAALPNHRAKLEVEMNKRWQEIRFVIEGEYTDPKELPSKRAVTQITTDVSKRLGLPAK